MQAGTVWCAAVLDLQPAPSTNEVATCQKVLVFVVFFVPALFVYISGCSHRLKVAAGYFASTVTAMC